MAFRAFTVAALSLGLVAAALAGGSPSPLQAQEAPVPTAELEALPTPWAVPLDVNVPPLTGTPGVVCVTAPGQVCGVEGGVRGMILRGDDSAPGR